MKAEKEKIATMTMADKAVPEIGTGRVIESFQKLLGQWNQLRPFPGAWSYCGPAARLLELMTEAVGPEDLPADVDQLVTFLKLPPVIRAVRQAQVLLSWPDTWPGKIIIRLEKSVSPDQYRSPTE